MHKLVLLVAFMAIMFSASFSLLFNPGTPDKDGFKVTLGRSILTSQYTVSFSGTLTGTPFASQLNTALIAYSFDYSVTFQYIKQNGRLYYTTPFKCKDCVSTPAGKKVQWDKINYVLNNRGSYDPLTIQEAIWELSEDSYFLIKVLKALLRPKNKLVEEANAKGAGFAPGPGQWTAAVLQPSITTKCNTLEGRLIVPYQLPGTKSAAAATSAATTKSAAAATSAAAASVKSPSAAAAQSSKAPVYSPGFPSDIKSCVTCSSYDGVKWCVDSSNLGRCALSTDTTCTKVAACCTTMRGNKEACDGRADCKWCPTHNACNIRRK